VRAPRSRCERATRRTTSTSAQRPNHPTGDTGHEHRGRTRAMLADRTDRSRHRPRAALASTGVLARCDLDTARTAGQWFTAAIWLLQAARWASATLAIAGYTGLVARSVNRRSGDSGDSAAAGTDEQPGVLRAARPGGRDRAAVARRPSRGSRSSAVGFRNPDL
jgi:hypothetical protein